MKTKKILFASLLAVVFVAGWVLHWSLPQEALVRVVGTTNKGSYYVTASMNGKSMVFRNEDTETGYPFYFKFNSAELQSQAQEFEKQKDSTVLVRYYGWRNKIFKIFPNIIKLENGEGKTPHPPFARRFVFLLLGLFFAVALAQIFRLNNDAQ